jgi:Fe-Mn family superoxide dismutase
MPFILPELPYDEISFGGLISAETFDFHHGKHHKAYVDKTNALVADDAALSGAPLSKVITAAKAKGNTQLFNNAAQIWNHSFYWQCLTPAGEVQRRGCRALCKRLGVACCRRRHIEDYVVT